MKLFLISIILFPLTGFAQPYETNPDFNRANHWFFGDSVWLDFNYNPPLNRNGSQLRAIEASTSYSDENGDLLLYSDGITVWNSNHIVIVNGNGIDGHQSSSQGAVFVKMPNNDSIIYLFTTDNQCNNRGLRYSKIKLHNNSDSIIVVEKNVQLINGVTESIAVTKHQNNTDIWIVVHSGIGNIFYSFLLTKEGVSKCPVETSIGFNYDGHFFNCQTKSKFNNKGSLYAITAFNSDNVQLYSFNNSIGEFSNYKLINNVIIPTGVAFTQNDSFLYFIERNRSIRRFNIKSELHDTVYTIQNNQFYIIDILSVKNILYMNILDSNHLAVVQNIESDSPFFNLHGLPVDNKRLTNGLPNFNQGYNYIAPMNFAAKLNCISNTIQFYGQDTFNANTHSWEISKQGNSVITAYTKAPLIEFADSGTYNVRYIAANGSRSDTVTKEITILPKINQNFLGNDTGWCEQLGASLTLQAPSGMHCYEWSNGSTGSAITADTTGTYWAKIVTPNFCVLYDTISVIVDTMPNVPIIYKDNDTLKTNDISPIYQWLKDGSSTGTNSPKLFLTDTGVYSLSIRNNGGCTASSDTIHIPAEKDTLNDNVSIVIFDGIKIYPNPFNNSVIIENPNLEYVQLNIYSIEGRVTVNKRLHNNLDVINTEHWTVGIYLIKLTSQNGLTRTFKLIKISE